MIGTKTDKLKNFTNRYWRVTYSTRGTRCGLKLLAIKTALKMASNTWFFARVMTRQEIMFAQLRQVAQDSASKTKQPSSLEKSQDSIGHVITKSQTKLLFCSLKNPQRSLVKQRKYLPLAAREIRLTLWSNSLTIYIMMTQIMSWSWLCPGTRPRKKAKWSSHTWEPSSTQKLRFSF
jgi:hypothetical protein